MRDLGNNEEYARVKTGRLISGDFIAYPVGTKSLVRSVTKIGWRKYRLTIQPGGKGPTITFTAPNKTVWWVLTGG